MQTKGKIENTLKNKNFERLAIFRPALIITERKESRLGELIAQTIAYIYLFK